MIRLAAIALLVCACGAVTMAQDFAADGREMREPSDARRGTLALLLEDRAVEAPILSAEFDVEISGMIGRTRVRQRFRNPTEHWVEAIYLYPLPAGAAVDRLSLAIGDRRIDGEIRERARAHETYREAKREGRAASLVEQKRSNLYTTSIANIGPGTTVYIDIEYQQTLSFDAGEFSLRIPLVAGPRYRPTTLRTVGGEIVMPGAASVARITPQLRPPGTAPGNGVAIRVRLDAGFPLADLRSLYHRVEQRASADNVYSIVLSDDSVPADRDFVLRWRARPEAVPRAAVFRERTNGHDYAMLMLVPPEGTDERVLPRDLVFVIDTSGSMDGTSIEQARDALVFALERLRPDDRFNIIRFATSTELLFPEPVAATSSQIQTAIGYVRGLRSRGGTEMFPALNAALRQFRFSSERRVRQVVFITDGNVANEDVLFDLITAAPVDARLFTVGIGSAPNAYFMTGAARHGRGSYVYIGDISEVGDKMSALFSKIERPVLSDVTIGWPDEAGLEFYPERVGDLFAGEPLLISVRGKLPPEIRVSGIVAGADWSETLPLRGERSPGVAVNWARARIRHLLGQRHRAAPGDPVYDAVVATALEHQQVSPYTSLVAVDRAPLRPSENRLESTVVPLNLPAGWRYAGLVGRLPAGATGAPRLLLIAVVFVSLSIALLIAAKWKMM